MSTNGGITARVHCLVLYLSAMSSDNLISPLNKPGVCSVIAVTVEEGPVYFSNDYGKTWVEEISAEEGNWSGIDLSNDGTKGVACEYGGFVWSVNAPGVTKRPTSTPTTRPTRMPTTRPTRRPTGQPTRVRCNVWYKSAQTIPYCHIDTLTE